VVLVALTVGGAVLSLEMYKYFAPKREEAKREVFENTPSYVRGKQQRLTDLCLEYETAQPEHQGALRNVILMDSEELRGNEFQMSAYVRDCLATIR